MFAGYVWEGLHAALQLSSGLVLPPCLWRVRLSSWIHGKRLRTEWVPQEHRPPLLFNLFAQLWSAACFVNLAWTDFELCPSLHQLVFQVHLDRTVTRSASALRQTNSAILCLDCVTALLVFMAPDVTKVQKNCLFRPIPLRHTVSYNTEVKLFYWILSLILVCAEGRYGPDCERECRCDNGGKCIPSTGACDCPAGFIGARCDISESETVAVINCECGLMSHLVCVCVCLCFVANSVSSWALRTPLCSDGAVWTRSTERSGQRSLYLRRRT